MSHADVFDQGGEALGTSDQPQTELRQATYNERETAPLLAPPVLYQHVLEIDNSQQSSLPSSSSAAPPRIQRRSFVPGVEIDHLKAGGSSIRNALSGAVDKQAYVESPIFTPATLFEAGRNFLRRESGTFLESLVAGFKAALGHWHSW